MSCEPGRDEKEWRPQSEGGSAGCVRIKTFEIYEEWR